MKEFDFTLKFSLASQHIDPDEYVERLGEAGCDDAVIGVGQKGRIALHFIRQSGRALDAVISAIKDVKHAIPDARLIEATPDLVGLSDIAEFTGSTRQNIRKLMLTHSHSFPTPVHAGTSSLWHFSNVLTWLEEEQNKVIDSSVKEIALVTMQVNIAKENVQSNQLYQSELLVVGL
jgi:predicted DNA-binding transcriptional regulator AlpA